MSYPTTPAFVYDFPTGDWDATTRSHPALAWLETYMRDHVENEDSNHTADSIGHHDDSWIRFGANDAIKGKDNHFQAASDVFKGFSEFYHSLINIVVWETPEGWESLGLADFYYNNHSGGKKTHQSHDGRKWHGVAPGSYSVHYKKGPDGKVQLGGVHIFNDSHAI